MAGWEVNWEDDYDGDDDDRWQKEEKLLPSHRRGLGDRSGSDGWTAQWRRELWRHSWNEHIFPSCPSSFESIFEILDCESWIP